MKVRDWCHGTFWCRAGSLLVAVALCGGVVSCGEERAVDQPGTQVLVPKGKTARERQERGQKEFSSITGGVPARLVWVQDPSEETSDTFAESDALHLMGWDPREGGPRQLVATAGNFGRPLLTPDGRHVVFTEKRLVRRNDSRQLRPIIKSVDWETGKMRGIGKGFAVDTWADPDTGKIWVYALEHVPSSKQLSVAGKKLVRFALEAPDQRESVWTRTPLSVDSVQVSRDGRRFAGLFPWPHAGVGDVGGGRWTKLDVGCWPGLAPDNSYVAWVFDGPHRNLRMVAPEGDRRWKVSLAATPDVRGKETYHPRWSNHPHFMVFTGPYTKKKSGSRNAISTGGLSAEIFIGKFSQDLQSIESTVRLTHNKNGDFYPDLWVGDAQSVTLAGFPQQPAVGDASRESWPPSPEGLVFVWRDLRAANEIEGERTRPACQWEALGIGRFTSHLGALLDGGGFAADPDSNAAIAAAVRSGRGVSLQMLLTEWPGATESAAPLVSWVSTAGGSVVALERRGDALVLHAGEGESRATSAFPHPPVAGRPLAVAIVWQGNEMRLALDGKWLGSPLSVPSGLAARWPDGRLVLGQAGPPPATGTARAALERVTVHGRAVADEELATRARIDLEAAHARTPPPRLRLRARVIEATAPDRSTLDTYRRMLVDHTYEVESVLEGSLDAKKIAVLHWAVLDDRAVPGFPRTVGQVVELDLEPHAAHPELQGELTDLESEDFNLPMFLDVATPAAPLPGQR